MQVKVQPCYHRPHRPPTTAATTQAFHATPTQISEANSHHPDLLISSYRNVTVTLYTHSVNGLTENDFILAECFDTEITVDYSPKWLKSVQSPIMKL